jgi:hypothetical protein
MKTDDQTVRQQLLELLRGGHAHQSLEQAAAGFPLELINTPPAEASYSAWRLLEHIRIAQWDILEFIRNPDHVSPDWPKGYWPAEGATADKGAWQATLEAIRADRQALQALVEDPQVDLYADLPHAAGYNLLREVLVAADHNAYHVGEFGLLRTMLESSD